VSGMPDWDYGAAKPVKEPDGMGDFNTPGTEPGGAAKEPETALA